MPSVRVFNSQVAAVLPTPPFGCLYDLSNSLSSLLPPSGLFSHGSNQSQISYYNVRYAHTQLCWTLAWLQDIDVFLIFFSCWFIVMWPESILSCSTGPCVRACVRPENMLTRNHDKKAQLTQGLRATALRVCKPLWQKTKLSQKPHLKPNITSIGKAVAKMAIFLYPRWLSAAIWDFWNSKVAPLDKPTLKTPP